MPVSAGLLGVVGAVVAGAVAAGAGAASGAVFASGAGGGVSVPPPQAPRAALMPRAKAKPRIFVFI